MMVDFPEDNTTYPATVPEIENNEPVIGKDPQSGAYGPANRSLKRLVDRTAFLKAMFDQINQALNGIDFSIFALKDGDYTGLRARGTTKADVGLPVVPNYPAAQNANSVSATEFATMAMLDALRQQLLTSGFMSGEVMIVNEQQPEGTGAGSAVNGQNTRALNTDVINTIPNASRAGNVITLPAGTFLITAFAEGWVNSDSHRLNIFNEATGQVIAVGQCNQVGGAGGITTTTAEIKTAITLAAPTPITLRHWFAKAQNNGLGIASNWVGQPELYASLTALRLN